MINRKICECGCCDDNNVMHLATHNKNRTVQLEELIVRASMEIQNGHIGYELRHD